MPVVSRRVSPVGSARWGLKILACRTYILTIFSTTNGFDDSRQGGVYNEEPILLFTDFESISRLFSLLDFHLTLSRSLFPASLPPGVATVFALRRPHLTASYLLHRIPRIMRTPPILLLFLSLFALTLAAGSSPAAAAGSNSAATSRNSQTGKTTETKGSYHEGSRPPTGSGSKTQRKDKEAKSPQQPETEHHSSTDQSGNEGSEGSHRDTPDPPEDGDDNHSTTRKKQRASKTTTAQEEKSTTFEANVEPTSLSMATSTTPSTGRPLTTAARDPVSASGTGTELADMNLLGLLLAVGMAVLAY